jgi:hypothetical protein
MEGWAEREVGVSGNFGRAAGADAGQAKEVPHPERSRRQPCSGCRRVRPGLCHRPALAPSWFFEVLDGPCRIIRPGGLTGTVQASAVSCRLGWTGEPSSRAYFPVQPLVRPWPEAMGWVSGRPSSRLLQGATARSGGQGRRRLAPGPEPRAAPGFGRCAWRAWRRPTPCP